MTHRYFIFQFQKALQATAYFLRLAGGRMLYIDILKMLYIADRECLSLEGETITGDTINALKKGPVLRTVKNLIKKDDSQWERWHHYIGTQFNSTTKRLEVFIKKHPGEGELYRFEKEIIQRVFEDHKDKDLVAYTHTFPEWQKYKEFLESPDTKNSHPITLKDILEGIGKPELWDAVKKNIADRNFQSKLFSETL